MAGLCEGGNKPSGSLKAICKPCVLNVRHFISSQSQILPKVAFVRASGYWMYAYTRTFAEESHEVDSSVKITLNFVHYRRYVRFKLVEYGEVRDSPMFALQKEINVSALIFHPGGSDSTPYQDVIKFIVDKDDVTEADDVNNYLNDFQLYECIIYAYNTSSVRYSMNFFVGSETIGLKFKIKIGLFNDARNYRGYISVAGCAGILSRRSSFKCQ
ncbi:hypothetical protein ANN_09988 [Periplaneta americana]|uniref:Uncharacterized protein n=1 Tax=Periplaneta americana TaxID=6978 RepID=A0ABQ8TQ43_PERAM|nr:hypothetical protein ANN_09988 [Periplaneta americana]